MGNRGSTGRRRNNSMNHHHEPPPPQPQPSQPPEAAGNRYVFAAATPYPPPQFPPPNLLPPPPPLQHQPPPPYYQYGVGNYNPPPPSVAPMPLPVPFDLHHRVAGPYGYPYGHLPPPPPSTPMPDVDHQKAVTIRNDVNLKKESLRMVPDEDNPGMFLVTFTFDATTAGSISVLFFAKEGFECNLTPTKEGMVDSVTIPFKEGLGQKFSQPSGTGINFSMFEEAELTREGGMDVYPLAVKAEAFPVVAQADPGDDIEDRKTGTPNSQITQAVFVKKENGEYQVRVVKQILWVNGTRYELQEIYGIGNSVDGDFDGSDSGKECVICLSEPRDTTVLPCRHMAYTGRTKLLFQRSTHLLPNEMLLFVCAVNVQEF